MDAYDQWYRQKKHLFTSIQRVIFELVLQGNKHDNKVNLLYVHISVHDLYVQSSKDKSF